MATMAMGMVQKHKYLLIAASFITHSLAVANEWSFEPYIKVNETYSDNVNFNNQSKQSSFVNQTSLGVNSKYTSGRAYYNLDAQSSYATYSHNSESNDHFLTLNGNGKLQLWPNGISLIGQVSIENQPQNNINNTYADIISGDTTQVERYSTGLEYSINNTLYTLDSNLIYNRTKVDEGSGERKGYSATFNTTNGINSNNIFWNITNNYTERENNTNTGRSYQSEFKIGYITPYKINPFIRYYDEGNSGNVGSGGLQESNSYGAGIRWLITQRLLIDLSYNTPIDNNNDTEDEQQDDYYDLSINWQPTSRTTLNANRSQRFYGDSYNFNFTHENKRLVNNISYSESIRVFTRDGFSLFSNGEILCSFNTNNADTDCLTFLENNNSELGEPTLIITEDNAFSLNKSLGWNSTLTLSRTTFMLNVSRNNRLNLSTNLKDLRQSADFSISRKISGYSNIDFSFAYTEVNNLIGLPQERKSQYRYYKLNYNRKINKTLSFDLSLSHLNRTSNPAQFVYKENRISLELKKVL